ncbi:MAG: hypothetical protein AAF363_10645 [Bacteroidota bacterium]
MKKLFFIIALVFGFGFLSQAQDSANTRTKRADARQKTQRARIAEGRASGEVTKREAKALRTNQRHIKRTERRAKADGEVTKAEKVKIEKKQDRASRRIREAKTNDIKKTDSSGN